MKTKVLLAVLSTVLWTVSAFAQLKVANNGNVGIQTGNNTPVGSFVVGNGTGSSTIKANIYSDNKIKGLEVIRGGTTSNWAYAINGIAPVTNYSIIMGVYGMSLADYPTGSGRAYGVLGYASNATDGYNYGVMGYVAGSADGAGIVGTSSGVDIRVPGHYAGYFVGNVGVTGLINGVSISSSDIRYKQNIVELGSSAAAKSSSGGILNTVLQLNPVQYNLKQQYMESVGDSATVKQALYDENSQLLQKKHYGLIAQDLQKLYPDLVYESDNGYLSINYTGLIPLMIQSIKELNAKIEVLENSKEAVGSQKAPQVQNPENVTAADATLYQNTPNPFSQSTRISYYLPEIVSTAQLCIYDLQGKQLKQIVISERGEGMQTISGSEFSPGIYLYALLADGKEVDVKRMILTE